MVQFAPFLFMLRIVTPLASEEECILQHICDIVNFNSFIDNNQQRLSHFYENMCEIECSIYSHIQIVFLVCLLVGFLFVFVCLFLFVLFMFLFSFVFVCVCFCVVVVFLAIYGFGIFIFLL